MTKEQEMQDMLFETVELETQPNTDTSVTDVIASDAPAMTDPEWNDYVMSMFTDKEMYNGNPLVNGLRRVKVVLGPIVYSGPTQVFPPQRDDHHGRATVVFTVEFQNGMRFSEVADCWEGNTDDIFLCLCNRKAASTRAEGRALRKALRIKAVAAEEMTKKDTTKIVRELSAKKESSDGGYDDSSRMSDAQSNFIDVKCRQLNIGGTTLLASIVQCQQQSQNI